MALLLVTVIWGGTFPILKLLVGELHPFYLVGLRFLLAFVALTFLCRARFSRLNRKVGAAGVTLGLLLWGAFITQTIGIQSTTASKAAFITALSVVLTPILATVLLRKHPGPEAIIGVILATAGLALLTLDFAAPVMLQSGDLWVLACAFLYALQIIMVDRHAASCDSLLLTWVEVGTVALVGLGVAIAVAPVPSLGQVGVLAGLAYLAFLGTAVAQFLQVKMQRYTSPTRVALIFSMEPVFAAAFAFLFLNERLPWQGWWGAGLVMAGLLVSELRFGRRRKLSYVPR